VPCTDICTQGLRKTMSLPQLSWQLCPSCTQCSVGHVNLDSCRQQPRDRVPPSPPKCLATAIRTHPQSSPRVELWRLSAAPVVQLTDVTVPMSDVRFSVPLFGMCRRVVCYKFIVACIRKPSKYPAWDAVCYLAYSTTLKMQAVCSSETSINI
jgi:hypothetical protein